LLRHAHFSFHLDETEEVSYLFKQGRTEKMPRAKKHGVI
jgi:hypothetical protein